MREIKFRAWDNVQNKILPVEVINFRQDCIVVDDGDCSITDTFEMFELMQFTGRYNKNGKKEIYDGDIVICFDYYDKIYFTGVVDFENCSFVIKNDECTYYRWQDYSIEEVIGNIYENPELLGDNK